MGSGLAIKRRITPTSAKPGPVGSLGLSQAEEPIPCPLLRHRLLLGKQALARADDVSGHAVQAVPDEGGGTYGRLRPWPSFDGKPRKPLIRCGFCLIKNPLFAVTSSVAESSAATLDDSAWAFVNAPAPLAQGGAVAELWVCISILVMMALRESLILKPIPWVSYNNHSGESPCPISNRSASGIAFVMDCLSGQHAASVRPGKRRPGLT